MATKTPTSTRQRATEAIVVREKAHRKDSREGYKALQNELVARLEHLRSEIREICDAYVENMDTDITILRDFLEGSSEVRAREDRKARTMRRWLSVLDDTSVKPRKGRRKDLKQVEKAVQKLMNSAFE